MFLNYRHKVPDCTVEWVYEYAYYWWDVTRFFLGYFRGGRRVGHFGTAGRMQKKQPITREENCNGGAYLARSIIQCGNSKSSN